MNENILKCGVMNVGFTSIMALTNNGDFVKECEHFINLNSGSIDAIDRKYFLSKAPLLRNSQADLLVVDVDSFGVDDASFLLFVAGIFSQELPVVLIVQEKVTKADRARLLQADQVLDIITISDSLSIA